MELTTQTHDSEEEVEDANGVTITVTGSVIIRGACRTWGPCGDSNNVA